jgi:hypothetical protein
MDLRLLVVAGFFCDKAAVTMATCMLREEISEMLYVLFQEF